MKEEGELKNSLRGDGDSATERDVELAQQDEQQRKEGTALTLDEELDWENAPENPQNWPAGKKALQVVMLSSCALLA